MCCECNKMTYNLTRNKHFYQLHQSVKHLKGNSIDFLIFKNEYVKTLIAYKLHK